MLMRRVVVVPRHAATAMRLRASSTRFAVTRHGDMVPRLVRLISSSGVLQTRKKTPVDANEAAVLQQMLDVMKQDEDGKEAEDLTHSFEMGRVLDVKNNVASMSGLRAASIGSVVSIYDEDDKCVCRGIVLLLGKTSAHVAFFNDQEHVDAVRKVHVGMHVRLDSQQLQVPVSMERLRGRAIDPVGDPVALVYTHNTDEDIDQLKATEHLTVSWGSKTVPPLLTRTNVQEAFTTGILALDCLNPIAMGHRFCIMGSKNSGKTRLMVDIVSQQVKAAMAAKKEPPQFVYVCVGKSPSRVQRILQLLEQTGALPYTTIVSADTQRTLIMRYLAPFTGCAIAEYLQKHTRSHQSVVIYDDLATHTTVVESLVQLMKLPKIARISLGAHAVLMERAGQFGKPMDSSITAFALADTPDTTTREVSELKDHLTSIVDDSVQFDSHLAHDRLYPPLDVLLPGPSIRGPPYLSAALWKYTNILRTRINEAYLTRDRVKRSKKLGLDLKPDEADDLEFQRLVRQFFSQEQMTPVSRVQKELGVFVLAVLQIRKLPPETKFWDLLDTLVQTLHLEHPDLLEQLDTYPFAQTWSKVVVTDLEDLLDRVLTRMRKEAANA